MAERLPCQVRFASSALHDLSEIWDWSIRHFGLTAALRYEVLVAQAISDLAERPERPGSTPRSDLLPGLWLYHLLWSRANVPAEDVVKSPRHFVLFRQPEPDIVEILRVLHDSRDLARHLPGE